MSQSRVTTGKVPTPLLEEGVRTKARLRLGRGLEALAKWAPTGMLFLTVCALSYRFGLISDLLLGLAAALTVTGWVLAFTLASVRGPGLLEAVLRLDEAHGLDGRLAAALDFCGALPPRAGPDTIDDGYVALVLEEAKRIGPLQARRAAPLRVPSGLWYGFAMLACWALLVVIPTREEAARGRPPVLPTTPPKTEWLNPDDAELLERAAEDLHEVATSEEGKDAAARFNEIVLLASSGDISRAEAFRLAAELEAELEAASSETDEWLAGLEARGAALEKRNVTREAGRAMSERDAAQAEEALRKLAERLSQENQVLSEKELDELRASLEEARGAVETKANPNSAEEQARAEEEQRLRDKQKRLLQKKEQGTATAQDKKELEETERKLERLDRQKKREQSAQKASSELDKQLAEAARQLRQEQKKSGEFLDRAADAVREGSKKQLSDAEKKELIKQIEALKEKLRRQNQEGNQADRLREFLERARGQRGTEQGGQQKPGGEGQPQPGELRLGPDGQPMPGAGEPGPGEPGQGQGEGEGDGESPGSGREPGKSHDPNLTGGESHLADAGTVDTTAVARDTGEGQSASETILGVAEEGFSAPAYDKLYREYQTVAEEVMEKEAVPQGRRAHVLRYFELIRPRGATNDNRGKK